MRKTCLVLLSMFLFGCAVAKPTPEQMRAAEYGLFPTNYKELVTQHITSRLIDPESAKFSDWIGPSQGWYGRYMSIDPLNPFGYEKKEYFGYKVCLYVNAKNRMGGYTGRLLHFLMIKNGTVILSASESVGDNTYERQQIYNLCHDVKTPETLDNP